MERSIYIHNAEVTIAGLIERVENHTESDFFVDPKLNHAVAQKLSNRVWRTRDGSSIDQWGNQREDVSLGEPTPGTSSSTKQQSVVGGRNQNGAPTLLKRVWFVDFVDFMGAKSTSQATQPCSLSPT